MKPLYVVIFYYSTKCEIVERHEKVLADTIFKGVYSCKPVICVLREVDIRLYLNPKGKMKLYSGREKLPRSS